MKKLFIFLLLATFMANMLSCSTQNFNFPTQGSNNGQNQPANNGTQSTPSSNQGLNKISGTIEDGTVFSEGLAFVKLYRNESTVYCINTDGYIVFSIDDPLLIKGMISTTSRELTFDNSFHYGLADINVGICDTKGNITFPEDVGVTSFDGKYSLKYGYILAEVIESTFESSSKKLGVMDTNFKWVVQPSEELHEKAKNVLFFKDGYLGFDNGYCLNVNTGVITTPESINLNIPSDGYITNETDILKMTDNYHSETALTISNTKNFNKVAYELHGNVRRALFVNGMCPVTFYNTDTKQYFFTLIDENGDFKFNPVAIEYDKHYCQIGFDGEIVAFSSPLQVFDANGNLLASENKTNLNVPADFSGYEASTFNFTVNDGIICYYGLKVYSNQSIWYFDKNLNLLFQ